MSQDSLRVPLLQRLVFVRISNARHPAAIYKEAWHARDAKLSSKAPPFRQVSESRRPVRNEMGLDAGKDTNAGRQ